MQTDIERYWSGLANTARAMPFKLITRAAEVLLECHQRGHTVFIVGNGGSAATASHFACDLSKGTQAGGLPPFRVLPLTDNVPLMTAWANDSSYECIFANQLAALVRPDDVLVAISASGNSPNVLAAASVARDSDATVVALTGRTGGNLRTLAHLTIAVPADGIEIVEDAHMAVTHSVCVALRHKLADHVTLQVEERPVEPVVLDFAL